MARNAGMRSNWNQLGAKQGQENKLTFIFLIQSTVGCGFLPDGGEVERVGAGFVDHALFNLRVLYK